MDFKHKIKYKKVTPELIEESVKDLEFYDKHRHFPWESKNKMKIKNWLKKNDETILWIIGLLLMLALALRGFGVI